MLKFLERLPFLLSGIILGLILIPGLPPHLEYKSYRVELPKRDYINLLNSNDVLSEAELFYDGPPVHLSFLGGIPFGVESVIELEDGSVIAGDPTGAVFKIKGMGKDQKIEKITQLSFPCPGEGKEGCSWPLGMRLDGENLFLMDVYAGVVKINLKTGSQEVIVKAQEPLDGKVSRFPEDLSISKDGKIYYSDGHTVNDPLYEQLGHRSGRLIKHDPKKKTTKVLLDDISFSNGVCLEENDEFVLVTEFSSGCIRRYYLKGDKKGTSDVFIEGLPGYPDNIRPNGKGGFYVALWAVWDDENSLNFHQFSERPILRKLILRVRHIVLEGIGLLKTIIPPEVTLRTLLEDFENYYVRSLGFFLNVGKQKKIAIVAELSKTGEVIAIFSDKTGKVGNLSQFTRGKKYGYLVEPFGNKIWRVKMDLLDNWL